MTLAPTIVDIEAAFADGTLALIVDAPTPLGRYSFTGSNSFRHDDKGQVVHVMSKPAGGEIRGYVLIDGALRLRTPAYPSEWRELDVVVSGRLGAPVIARSACP